MRILRIDGTLLLEIARANLRKADLRKADLSGADLSGADLRGADLRGADLSGAYLSGADLSGADLRGAYLRGAYLSGANLRGADLRGADLSGADLSGADLSGADLSGADLSGAYLSGANLRGADLSGAYLSGADLDKLVSERSILPDGVLIGWKKLADGSICKLRIPEDAKRVGGVIGRKCRADVVEVLAGAGHSAWDETIRYAPGSFVRPTLAFDPNPLVECSSGIHFYITKLEAENH